MNAPALSTIRREIPDRPFLPDIRCFSLCCLTFAFCTDPVLGALFRSSDYQQQETDLVVIVTPHLVAPVVPGQRLASPLDERLPSNDVDFFLNGQPDVRKRYTDFVTSGADLAGPYGHIIAPPNGSGGVQGAVVRAK